MGTVPGMTAVDDLYALPPEEFTAARNELAKQLRSAGDKEAAAEVGRRRRPSVGAWALNQVAREEPDLIEAALEAGEALRAAADAAADGAATGLREATAAERAAAQAVGKAAKRHLGARGEALVPSLLATLRAAALDADVADQVRRGTLVTEHEQAGFGFGLDSGDAAVTPRRAASKAKPKGKGKAADGARPALKAVPDLPAPDPEEAAREKAARAEAKAVERQRKKDLAAAERTAARLEREAARLAKEADDAEADARAARTDADAAAERAAAAQEAVAALEAGAPGR